MKRKTSAEIESEFEQRMKEMVERHRRMRKEVFSVARASETQAAIFLDLIHEMLLLFFEVTLEER